MQRQGTAVNESALMIQRAMNQPRNCKKLSENCEIHFKIQSEIRTRQIPLTPK